MDVKRLLANEIHFTGLDYWFRLRCAFLKTILKLVSQTELQIQLLVFTHEVLSILATVLLIDQMNSIIELDKLEAKYRSLEAKKSQLTSRLTSINKDDGI